MLMLADTDVSVWVLKVWEKDAPPAIEAFVNNQLRPRKSLNRPGISGGSNSQVDWSHDEQDDEQI
jgi:hypothetical protein